MKNYHTVGMDKYSNVQGWENKAANEQGYPAFSLNGVVANWAGTVTTRKLTR